MPKKTGNWRKAGNGPESVPSGRRGGRPGGRTRLSEGITELGLGDRSGQDKASEFKLSLAVFSLLNGVWPQCARTVSEVQGQASSDAPAIIVFVLIFNLS